jgi:hypothetical protein
MVYRSINNVSCRSIGLIVELMPRRFPSECTLLLGAGIVPRLFFLSVTRKFTTVRHSGLDTHSGQNPAIENIPDNNDTNQIKQIHISSPLCFSVLRGRRSVNQPFDFTLKNILCATILPQCLHQGCETICLPGRLELLLVYEGCDATGPGHLTVAAVEEIQNSLLTADSSAFPQHSKRDGAEGEQQPLLFIPWHKPLLQ